MSNSIMNDLNDMEEFVVKEITLEVLKMAIRENLSDLYTTQMVDNIKAIKAKRK